MMFTPAGMSGLVGVRDSQALRRVALSTATAVSLTAFSGALALPASAAGAPGAITVDLSSDVSSVAQNGGDATFTVTLHNNGSSAATLTALDTRGYSIVPGADIRPSTCAADTVIAAGQAYSCTFEDAVSGPAGKPVTRSVEATLQDASGQTITTAGSTSILVRDDLPDVSVSIYADPLEVTAPGGTVSFAISLFGGQRDGSALTSLVIDGYGDVLDPANPAVTQTPCTRGLQLGGEQHFCDVTLTLGNVNAGALALPVTATVTDAEDNTATDMTQLDVTVKPAPTAPGTSQPTKPGKPTKPTKPGKPTKPSKPTKPAKPRKNAQLPSFYALHSSEWAGTKARAVRGTVVLTPQTKLSAVFGTSQRCAVLMRGTLAKTLSGTNSAPGCRQQARLLQQSVAAVINEAALGAAYPASSTSAIVLDTRSTLAAGRSSAINRRTALLSVWNQG